mmetsp:Transcript_84028/g.187881  ORF Transcript_84028/g.187881 Transcript_84028/m.187881 type:complete len:674 (-) Transcript_84028:76-2097(-)
MSATRDPMLATPATASIAARPSAVFAMPVKAKGTSSKPTTAMATATVVGVPQLRCDRSTSPSATVMRILPSGVVPARMPATRDRSMSPAVSPQQAPALVASEPDALARERSMSPQIRAQSPGHICISAPALPATLRMSTAAAQRAPPPNSSVKLRGCAAMRPASPLQQSVTAASRTASPQLVAVPMQAQAGVGASARVTSPYAGRQLVVSRWASPLPAAAPLVLAPQREPLAPSPCQREQPRQQVTPVEVVDAMAPSPQWAEAPPLPRVEEVPLPTRVAAPDAGQERHENYMERLEIADKLVALEAVVAEARATLAHFGAALFSEQPDAVVGPLPVASGTASTATAAPSVAVTLGSPPACGDPPQSLAATPRVPRTTVDARALQSSLRKQLSCQLEVVREKIQTVSGECMQELARARDMLNSDDSYSDGYSLNAGRFVDSAGSHRSTPSLPSPPSLPSLHSPVSARAGAVPGAQTSQMSFSPLSRVKLAAAASALAQGEGQGLAQRCPQAEEAEEAEEVVEEAVGAEVAEEAAEDVAEEEVVEEVLEEDSPRRRRGDPSPSATPVARVRPASLGEGGAAQTPLAGVGIAGIGMHSDASPKAESAGAPESSYAEDSFDEASDSEVGASPSAAAAASLAGEARAVPPDLEYEELVRLSAANSCASSGIAGHTDGV